ncbi:MAG: hypothetical protein FWD23_04565, partial [Oscillospiraceae bacterium]|nr:hypothetical protein [Oscillospiraceae bacterium]
MGRLNDTAENYAKRNPVRFHMPGHKGRPNGKLGYPLDLTELFFTDSLYSPSRGINLIYALEEKISKCFFQNADIFSLISCSGATTGVQASVLALKKSKASKSLYIICDRASHVSFVNTISLLDMVPLWIYPGEDFLESIGAHARKHGPENIAGVFVTSPDYYGDMKDIGKISAECKKYSLGLVVDNSHGSHLAFHKNGSLHPINLGADISIDSVHKTLPVLTGAALLFSGGKFDKEQILRPAVNTFASTSPSYLILLSIESMTELLECRGISEHERLLADILAFEKKAGELGFVFEGGKLRDPYRIVLNCAHSGEKLYY